ncbi:hypothetical protein PCORN_05743 [Listeria cornellensis FSL F6-0969]|uniref:Uncharacterized protein n=1 Tax=Listeria cornellensis FSL F6-0969 TaxID=1265820 RepID=W7CEV0_9LIST|nr:hypothetical protein PCORN_05743 [Listeria cornellensis FSL F6-0969]
MFCADFCDFSLFLKMLSILLVVLFSKREAIWYIRDKEISLTVSDLLHNERDRMIFLFWEREKTDYSKRVW